MTTRILETYGAHLLNRTGGIDAGKFYATLEQALRNSPYERDELPLIYPDGSRYCQVRLASPKIGSGDKVVEFTFGFHANEVFSPFFLLDYAAQIFDYARSKGVKVILYPLVNPSGAAILGKNPNERYNGFDAGGDSGNNSAIYYNRGLGNGLVDDLGLETKYKRTIWVDQIQNYIPPETKAMLYFIRRDLDLIKKGVKIKAYGDLHGDFNDHIKNDILKVSRINNPEKIETYVGPGFYFYCFEDHANFNGLVWHIENIIGVPAIKNALLISDEYIRNKVRDKTGFNGGITRFDGSFQAAFHEYGVKHAVTVEVTQGTRLDQAKLVYWVWTRRLIDLAAAS